MDEHKEPQQQEQQSDRQREGQGDRGGREYGQREQGGRVEEVRKGQGAGGGQRPVAPQPSHQTQGTGLPAAPESKPQD